MYKFHIYSVAWNDDELFNRYPALEKYTFEDGCLVIQSLEELISLKKDLGEDLIIMEPREWEDEYDMPDMFHLEIYDSWREN